MTAPEANQVLKTGFPRLVDLSKAMKDYYAPNLDLRALLEAQRKNMQAITVVNQAAFENFQSYIQRQAALMAQELQVNTNLIGAIMTAPTAQEKILHQAAASKTAIDQCFANVRDAAETLAKCNHQVMEIVSNRMTEGLEELRGLIKKDLVA